MPDEWAFWAGLANMDRGWCVMDCRRECDDRKRCEHAKQGCGRDVELVRERAEAVLIDMAERKEVV
jgi:hypothetical protein